MNRDLISVLRNYYEERCREGCRIEAFGIPYNRERTSLFLQLLDLRDGDLLLDVGCGDWATTQMVFAQMASTDPIRVVGLDLAMINLQLAKRLTNIQGHLINGLCETLPLETASIDKVLCAETLEHVLDERRTLHEIFRVLKPGGIAVFEVPNDYHLFRFLPFAPDRFLTLQQFVSPTRVARLLADYVSVDSQIYKTRYHAVGVNSHIRSFSHFQFRRLLESQGFENVKIVGLLSPLILRKPTLQRLMVHPTWHRVLTAVAKLHPSLGRFMIARAQKPHAPAS